MSAAANSVAGRWHTHARAGTDASSSPPRRGGRYALLVSQPEIQRQVRQQRGDIDALYELLERVDQKVDALDAKVDCRFDEISGQLSEPSRVSCTLGVL